MKKFLTLILSAMLMLTASASAEEVMGGSETHNIYFEGAVKKTENKVKRSLKMKRKNFLALVMCFFLTMNTFIMGTVSAKSDILYYGAHKTVEVSGQTDELYANKFVTLVLKAENKI